MTTWEKQKLGNLIKIRHGYAFKGEYFSDLPSSNILLTPGNFAIGGGFQLNKPKYYDGPVPEDFILKAGDLVVTMTDLSKKGDTLGYPAIIPNLKNTNLLHNQRIGLISKNNPNIDLRFLYYLLRTQKYQKFIVGSASGATVHHTSPNRIYEYIVDIPNLEIQSSIATVISAYDDLIENNEKRIKILEEMAQRLYTEWFVKFKFPGHEKVKIVNSSFGKIPEGWVFGKLGEKVLINKGKNITEKTVIPGEVPVIAAGKEPAYFHNQANTIAPVITISASGANAGFINLHHEDIWASDCSIINREVTPFIFYYYLLLTSKKSEIDNLQRGAAQPHVYPKDLMSIRILQAPESLIENFENLISPIFRLIANLSVQNQNLAKIRDLLIPQLVTGRRLLKS